MDVLLTVTALGLSSYLPKCVTVPGDSSKGPGGGLAVAVAPPPLTIRVAATLSFLLLGLSISDFVPPSWMLFLQQGNLLPTAYRSILKLLVMCVLIVFPAILGARLVPSTTNHSGTTAVTAMATTPLSRRSNSNNYSKHSGNTYWVISICWKVGTVLSQFMGIILYGVCIKPLCRLLGLRSAATSTTASSPLASSSSWILPITTNNSTGWNNSKRPRLPLGTLLASLITVGVNIAIMSTISPWFVRTIRITTSNPPQQYHHDWLSVTISWLCALGILLSSIVNGFGSVSLPYSCLAGLYLEPISDEAVHRAQQELHATRQAIIRRQEELDGEVTTPSSGSGTASGGHTISSSWSFSFPTSRTTRSRAQDNHQESRRNQLQQDIEFLNTLVRELEEEILDMLEAKEMARQARTPWGRVRSWIGVMFSLVLVLRLVGAAWFVWRHDHGGSRGGSDLVTMTVLWLIGHNYVNQQQYNTLSQVISLLLTAYLSMAQVRTFVRAVDAVYQRLRRCWRPCHDSIHHHNSSSIDDSTSTRFVSLHAKLRSGSAYAPVVASLMSCYFLACVMLTKLLVPSAYRKALAMALETPSAATSGGGGDGVHHHDEIHFEGGEGQAFFLRIRSYAVNSVFLVTAILSTLALGMMLGLQRHQSLRHRPSVSKMAMESV